MPQSDAGAVLPFAASASVNATYVFGGNFLNDSQLWAAVYLRPVIAATAATPPSALKTCSAEVK